MNAPKYIKNPVATLKGWVSADKPNEILKAQRLTQEQCDEFNGVKAEPKPKAKAKPKAKPKAKKTIKQKLKEVVTLNP